MKGTPADRMVFGLALTPTNINTTPILGATITAPWKIGRFITFLLTAGAMTTNDALTVRVQGLKKSDLTTWVDVQNEGNTADLTFTVSKSSDTGVLDTGFLFGSLDLDNLRSFLTNDEFAAIRLNLVNGAAQNVMVSASYIISMLRREPGSSTDSDDLIAKQATQYKA